MGVVCTCTVRAQTIHGGKIMRKRKRGTGRTVFEAPTERLVAYVPPTRKEWVEQVAREMGLSASVIVNLALADYRERVRRRKGGAS